MNPFRYFSRPEYFFRPAQIKQRFLHMLRKPNIEESVRLPWGRQIKIRPAETIGAAVYAYGIFDLIVCEAIARLLDPGEVALEVGANIGLMASLMRHCTGPEGRVMAFEPHPEIFLDLSRNSAPCEGDEKWAPIEIHQLALGLKDGEAWLDAGPHWATNRGMSHIVDECETASDTRFRVEMSTLDKMFPSPNRAGVCKIDVEGHEPAVLAGAECILRDHRIRDLILEDFNPYPSTSTQILEDHGYTLFRLREGWARPRLVAASSPGKEYAHEPARDFLATLEPDRALKRFKPFGWKVLCAR